MTDGPVILDIQISEIRKDVIFALWSSPIRTLYTSLQRYEARASAPVIYCGRPSKSEVFYWGRDLPGSPNNLEHVLLRRSLKVFGPLEHNK